MGAQRSISMLVQPDQWARCAHDGTALLADGGVELDWTDDDVERCTPDPDPGVPAGLAFDRRCVAYRSWPREGAVDAVAVGQPVTRPCVGPLAEPRGLAVDDRQRLYVCEVGSRCVLVVDVWSRRQLHRIPFGPDRPVDVVADGHGALVLLQPGSLVRVEGRRRPRPGPRLRPPRCPDGLVPTRVTSGPLALWSGPGYGVVARPDGTVEMEVDGATDIELTPAGVLVVARGAGRPLRRFVPADSGWRELEPLGAPAYDGGALAVDPSGRLAITSARGYDRTTGSVAPHVTDGSVTTYRLDSGVYRTRWGRLFLDACVPPSTSVQVRFLTTDADDVPDPMDPAPARRSVGRLPFPDATPPLPSKSLMTTALPPYPLLRRPDGRESPWQQIAADDATETYETVVHAEPGRYLWIRIDLQGTAAATPKVRALRVERPGHRLLDALPRAWSRDDADADFVFRFLAPADGVLHDLDLRSAERAILLDPTATPQETLPWLASFAGLVLDRRWPEAARRQLVTEAYPLFARRGTKAGLLRILEIYLGRTPVIVEAWQLRGLGGAVLGLGPQGLPSPAVAASARETGTLGRFTIGAPAAGSLDFASSAHRYTVLVPGELTDEQRDVVRSLLASHQPAHTMYDLCELGAGMRVGGLLRVEVTSFVGLGSGCTPTIAGQSRLGEDAVIGTAADGSRVGDARVGTVAVG